MKRGFTGAQLRSFERPGMDARLWRTRRCDIRTTQGCSCRGEVHHGCVYDERGSGESLNAHCDAGNLQFFNGLSESGAPFFWLGVFYEYHPWYSPCGPSFGRSNLFHKDLWAAQKMVSGKLWHTWMCAIRTTQKQLSRCFSERLWRAAFCHHYL